MEHPAGYFRDLLSPDNLQPMTTPLVSVYIRSRNESQYIGRCLEAVLSQHVDFPFEVVVLDSQSEDDTAEIAKNYDVKVYSIPPKLFTYSSALNLSLGLCQGEYIAPLSAHTIPCDDRWMMFHVEHLRSNKDVVATYSRQIPWPQASDIQTRAIANTFPEEGHTISAGDLKEGVSQGVEPYKALRFSNASSFIRSSFLREKPFREMPFSEDRAMVFDALTSSHQISYVADAVVYHSHAPNFREFYVESNRATLSRGIINNLYADYSSNDKLGGIPESLIALYFKLVPLTALVVAQLGICSVRRLLGSKKAFADLKFYLASFGTTLGKIRGVWEFARIRDYAAPAAETTQLKESLTKLK